VLFVTLVYADDRCVGWCQYGTATELPNIKNPEAYAKDLGNLPDWRIGCIFTGKSHRGQGVARAAVSAALAAIKEAGAGCPEPLPRRRWVGLPAFAGTTGRRRI